jgi:ribosomal protein S18 acetylase RimI-like enzyme
MTSLREAKGRSDLRAFVSLPRRLYAEDPFWAPPLWAEERTAYSASRNAILARSDFTLLLAERDGKVVGRSLVYVDRRFNAHYGSRIGFFGAFECDRDIETARLLDRQACRWLSERGMERIRGPIHPVSECWGFLRDGFDAVPVFLTPYNPPYYNDFLEGLGYGKAKDLLAYEASAPGGYSLPDRFEGFRKRFFANHPDYRFRRLEKRTLLRDAEAIWRITDTALRDNWGYVPVEESEFRDMVGRLKPIVDPDAVWFIDHGSRTVGYALGFPDLNVILREIGGRLFPFGFLRLLTGIRKVRRYRLFGLAVLPEYHNRGLDALLYAQIHRSLAPKGVILEANYILEDNLAIRNALEKLGMRHVKTYRVYEKSLEGALS